MSVTTFNTVQKISLVPTGVLAVAMLTMALGMAGGAAAQEVDYPAIALEWARQAASAALQAGSGLRLEVSVGGLDGRLRLAPCANVEPYSPPGSRLWGKTRVALRCVDGMARWNVSMPATVKAFGPAWVVKTPVMPGGVVSAADVVQAEVDWAEESQAVLAETRAWLGQVAARQLNTGQTLRQGMVRAPQVFMAGAQVRLVAQGQGFQVSSDAQALTAGVVGQPARVRLDNGRVTSGMVLDARTVKIEL
ncbi:MAG: flagellar basal body P-ring formation protein FlgA [Pseudomonadota bacterium]|jgi:flagellar basal body P-ring formation protein FlgA